MPPMVCRNSFSVVRFGSSRAAMYSSISRFGTPSFWSADDRLFKGGRPVDPASLSRPATVDEERLACHKVGRLRCKKQQSAVKVHRRITEPPQYGPLAKDLHLAGVICKAARDAGRVERSRG